MAALYPWDAARQCLDGANPEATDFEDELPLSAERWSTAAAAAQLGCWARIDTSRDREAVVFATVIVSMRSSHTGPAQGASGG